MHKYEGNIILLGIEWQKIQDLLGEVAKFTQQRDGSGVARIGIRQYEKASQRSSLQKYIWFALIDISYIILLIYIITTKIH